MPVYLLLVYIVITVLLGFLAVWVIGQFAPTHPPIIDRMIWVVIVLVVVLQILSAFGILGSGPTVPRLGGR